MNTHIPTQSLFLTNLLILEGSIKVIERKHHSNDVSDIKSYQVIILKRIVKSLSTIEFVLNKEVDSMSAYGILRMIIDSICIYCFIYEKEDKDEVEFRHYLYLLDGCSQYNKLISSLEMKNEIEKKSEDNLQKNNCDLKSLQCGIENALSSHNYSKKYGKEAGKIVKSANWKYKLIGGEGENKYNWEELYKEIGYDYELSKLLSNYLSQYVHGLFMSNTMNPQAKSHHHLIYMLLVQFTRRLIRSLNKTFAEENILENLEVDSKKLLNSEIDFRDVGQYLKNMFIQ